MELAIALTLLATTAITFWCFFQFALIDPLAPRERPSIFAQCSAVVLGLTLFIGSQAEIDASFNHALLGFMVISAIAPARFRSRDGKPWWKHWLEGVPDRLRRLVAHKLFGLLVWVLAIILAPPNWTVLTALAVIPIMHYKTASILETLGLPITEPDSRRTSWIVRSYASVIAFLLIWTVAVFSPAESLPTTAATISTVAGIGLGALVLGFVSE